MVVVFGVLHEAKQVGAHQHSLRDLEGPDLDVLFGHSGEIASCRWPHPQHLVDEVVGKLHFLHKGNNTPRSSYEMFSMESLKIDLISSMILFLYSGY